MTTKIMTWNINGFRAVLGKGGLSTVLAQNPDILMLQEIKTRPDQISAEHNLAWDGFEVLWHAAERPGYSGVATFFRSQPLDMQVGLGDQRFDQEGRAILVRYPDFTLVNAYFPSGQRGHERVNYKLDFYASLLKICDRLHAQGEQIIIGGDFNTAHQEIDLRNPKQNRNTSGFLPEERSWVDRYLEHGFVDAYRELHPTQVRFTWWTYISNARSRNVGWRLDYFLVSKSLMPRVQDVIIHTDILGSDHCPVSIVLD